ncbi:thiamine ABC transporter substrate-binding protein [Halorubellus sp. JP-L1]|uniref:thiamine ABC transporter substrate-binding protein n=1 Tax=Halorubellus sp. JP-L1 TaxID=2715753 RepID=UPI00140B3E80|nr:thiamine ABC transporter substrate-binding protein [Halorubellus sp. JP-L1]NHN43555.1 thiamine ABC transporter substrate-binding protein [Halorubellus sp. JP-L1]
MERRDVIASGSSLVALGLAGCITSDDEGSTDTGEDANATADGGTTQSTASTTTNEELEGTLTVATYGSFVDAPSSSPGPWIKEAFERRHPNVTLEFETKEKALDHYILRKQNGASVGADAYVGMKVPELVRVDEELDEPLFESVRTDRIPNYDAVKSGYTFDPDGRVLPLFTGYCAFVYNDYEVDAPETLDDLTTDAFAGEVTVQNAQSDNTGLYFLLWTVKEYGEDGYLDYWERLLDNDVTVLDSWGASYGAFTSGETNVVTSFSTDQVYANRSDADLKKHQVAFPGDNGYTNLSGIGKFADSDRDRLVEAFVDFMLGPDAQGKLAELNVSFPVTDHGAVPDVFEEYAKEPPEPLLYSYDDLVGRVGEWREEWARTVASNKAVAGE